MYNASSQKTNYNYSYNFKDSSRKTEKIKLQYLSPTFALMPNQINPQKEPSISKFKIFFSFPKFSSQLTKNLKIK